MSDGKRDLLNRLPKPGFNRKNLSRRLKKAEVATIRHAHKFIIKRLDSVRDVQRHVIFWVLAMGLLIAATGLQLIGNQQDYQTTATARDETYAEAVLGPVESLNPIFAKTNAEQSASRLLFSRLLYYDKTGHLDNDLATNIKINDKKTTYTVFIRPDVKWHDGVKLTAHDVEFTIELMRNPIMNATDTGWANISTKVVNDTTIEFTLRSTYAAFEHALTFSIVPKHILGKVNPVNIMENNFSQNPIGSGPFKLNLVQDMDAKSGRKIIYMVRNDDYHGGTANLARFQLHVYNTTDEIVNALKLKEVNSAAGLLSSDLENIDKKHYIVSAKPIQSGVYAILNTTSNTLKDIKLRQALQLATNTSEIRKKLPDETKPLDLPIISNQVTGNLPKIPTYNLSGAKRLLDMNGWKLNSKKICEKDGKELILSVVTTKNNELERALDIISNQWRSLGIKIETKIIDLSDANQNVFQSVLQPRNFDVLLYQLNIGADPDVYAYWHSSQRSMQGLNFSNYANDISDDALTSARSRSETDLRTAKYIIFAKQWITDIPAIGLYQSTFPYVTSNNAHSFDNSNNLVSPIDRYSDVLDWAVGSRNVYKTP